MTDLQIGFLIYPGVVQLDIMGPYQVLAFPPHTQLHLIAESSEPVISNEGLTLLPTTTFQDCPALDVICVPGGGLGQIEVMTHEAALAFLRAQANHAAYVTSVCTGSLILAAAGLLKNYRATCHWAFRDQLAHFGVEVLPERVVIDRDRVTGAGVTSGIDFGLTLLGLLCDEATAKTAQLIMEYNPEPPFSAGTPEQAGAELVEPFMAMGKPLLEGFWEATQIAKAKLN